MSKDQSGSVQLRLAPRILLQIGSLLAVVVVGVTFLGYANTFRLLEADTVSALNETVSARTQSDSSYFRTAQDNTYLLRDEYVRRLTFLADQDPVEEFDKWFSRYPDGIVRVRPERDDNTDHPSVYIRYGTTVTPAIRRQVVAAFQLLEEWGPPMTSRYYSAYIDLPGISLIMYSPSVNWGAAADAQTNNFDYPPVRNSAPDRNVSRHNAWTEVYFDDKAGIWMVSTITPVDFAGEWVATASQDVAIDELIKRTHNDRLAGAYNIVLAKDGRLLAHRDLYEKIKASNGSLLLADLHDSELNEIAESIYRLPSENAIQTLETSRFMLGVGRIAGPDWYFVTVYPKAVLQAKATQNAKSVLLGGGFGLLVAMLLLYLIIRWQVARRLAEMEAAADKLAAGNLNTEVIVHRQDELGHLAEAMNRMSSSLLDRNQQLQDRAAELELEIQQRQRSEQALQERETQFRTLVASVPCVVYRCDADQKWTMRFISAAVTDLVGYSVSDFIDGAVRRWADVMLPEDVPEVAQAVEVACQQRGDFTVHYRVQRADGAIRHVYERGRPFYTATGAIAGLDGVIVDTTELLDVQKKLELANATLERTVEERTRDLRAAMKELEHFGFVVSHDLRAPLRHLASYSAMLAEVVDSADVTAAKEYIRRIEQSVTRMRDLVNGLWDLAKLGQSALALVPVALKAEVESLLQEMPETSHYLISMNELPTVLADKILIRQVLQNMLGNAVKYSAKTAAPHIAIHDRSETLGNGDEYVIEIADNGVGFDPAYSDKLFVLFQRLHRADEFAGTGVGLALCAKIIALHGGRMWAEGAPGKGARFYFSIPKTPRHLR